MNPLLSPNRTRTPCKSNSLRTTPRLSLSAPWPRSADDVQVQMVHLLTTIRTGIELCLETADSVTITIYRITAALLLRQLRRQQHHFTQQWCMAFITVRQRSNVLL